MDGREHFGQGDKVPVIDSRCQPALALLAAGCVTLAFWLFAGSRTVESSDIFLASTLLLLLAAGIATHRLSQRARLETLAHRRLLATALDAAGAMFILRDASGRLLHASAAAERISGYSSAELGHLATWEAALPPADFETLIPAMAAARQGDHPLVRECPWLTRQGSIRLIRWSVSTLDIGPPGHAATIMVGVDVTDLRNAETERKRSETFLRLANQMARLAYWYWRPSHPEGRQILEGTGGAYTYSDDIGRLLGYGAAEIPPENSEFVRKFVHPEDRATVLGEYERFIEGGEASYAIEYRIIHRSGEQRHMRETGIRIRDEEGCIIQVAGTFQDVTEIRRSEMSLQHAEAELRRTLRMSGLVSWSWLPSPDSADGESGTYHTSAETAEVLGLELEEIKLSERQWHELIVHPDDASAAFQAMEQFRLGPEAHFSIEYRLRPRHGGTRHVRSLCEKTFDGSGRLVEISGALIDITEQRLREIDLVRAKNAAEVANRSKSEFLANMSHELRTPLNAVIGFSQVIRDQLFGVADERYASYAADIHRSGQMLLRLISDILDMSKLEAGKVELFEEWASLAEIAEECIRMLQARADEGGVRIERNWPADLPRLRADARATAQILLNVLGNAIKFSPSGRPVQVSIRPSDGGDMLLVVRDAGIGMSQEAMRHLFTAFHQADATISRRFGGSGLGLAITRRLIELHGGSIDISSEENAGTRVILRFPAARVGRVGSEMAATAR